MKKKKKKITSAILAEMIIKGIQEKKGKDIVCLDLRNIENSVSDFFVICEGSSTTQLEAIARSIEETVINGAGEKPWHSEGKENAQWILIDYVSVVVHVFQNEVRSFYNLEGLWADAEIQKIAV